ncbi:probable selenium-dependent hydroxylase accessory protein YqeC [Austwickia chelonae]|uniref:Selenium-dependent hydroxylase accessory protein YqeC n=1 Tax=Austwickia chelonae NBRC 105200 TaxID=1184607 RepID=K6W479_9MICO|nr:selenium cofactor biosynthesis protein YqeC [Austwickia chelonae]GAB76607.1 hypothetical protein AUCHE_01_01690 [Austwickia chelonae NBRC 105200]SEW27884.1 probable selenium-dependent hydroxylase accessory protein YqeC [Austwickia chelonae]
MTDRPVWPVVWEGPGRAGPGLLSALGVTELLETCVLGCRRRVVLAAVGAGGKTTLLRAVGQECAVLGLSAVLTTTTRLWLERGAALDVEEALARRDEPGLLVAGQPCGDGKISAFPGDGIDRLRSAFDVVLVEADGARGLPFKVPAAHEPVVPPAVDLLLVVASVDALCRPLEQVCFRSERAREILGIGSGVGADLDAGAVAMLLQQGYLDPARRWGWAGQVSVVLTHVDGGVFDEDIRALIGLLDGHQVICVGVDPSRQVACCRGENGTGREDRLPIPPAWQGDR